MTCSCSKGFCFVILAKRLGPILAQMYSIDESSSPTSLPALSTWLKEKKKSQYNYDNVPPLEYFNIRCGMRFSWRIWQWQLFLLDVKALNHSSSLVYRLQMWRHQAVSLPPGHEWHHCKLFVLRLAPCHAHAAGACLQYPWIALSLLTPQFPKIPPIFLRWLRADFSLSRELVASLEIAKAEHAQKDNILFISCRSCLFNTMWPTRILFSFIV